MPIELVVTEDGSHTLKLQELDETYHSTKGALTESMHVFVEMGMKHWLQRHQQASELRILEVGFGTGLNAILTFQAAAELMKQVYYIGIEPYPVPQALLHKMNYSAWVQDDAWSSLFLQMHQAPWGKDIQIGSHAVLQKVFDRLEQYRSAPAYFDVIYFDAFAPKKQPDMWAVPQLEKCYNLLRKGGALVTYCASGQFKRDLKSVGFEVEKVQGPVGGKREMTRAYKPGHL